MIQTPEQYEFLHRALMLFEKELPETPTSGTLPLTSSNSSNSSKNTSPSSQHFLLPRLFPVVSQSWTIFCSIHRYSLMPKIFPALLFLRLDSIHFDNFITINSSCNCHVHGSTWIHSGSIMESFFLFLRKLMNRTRDTKQNSGSAHRCKFKWYH